MTRKLSSYLAGILASWLLATALCVAPLSAAPPDPTNVVFSQVGADTLSVDWQGTTGTTIQFTVELSSSATITPFSSTTFMLSSTFTALEINTQYFTRVIAIDTVDLSSTSWTASVSTYTLANPPLSLTAPTVSATLVELAWDDNGNPFGTIFSIERSSDGISFDILGTETATTFSDSSITPGLTYTYRVSALNDANVPSAYSNSVIVTIPGSSNLPRIPSGFTLTRTQTGPNTFQIDFAWHAVTERENGTVLSNLAGYRIYTSTSLLTPRAQWVNVSTPVVESWTTVVNTDVTYYAFRTIDTNGTESDWSRVMDDSSDLNHFFFGEDFISRVQLPESSAQILLRANNSYAADLEITVTQVTAEETGNIAKSLHFKLLNADTQSEITAPTFDLPVMRGILAFTVQGGVVVQGSPAHSPAAIPVINASEAAARLSLFWFNGNEWVKTTGVVNTADNTISFTGTRIGRFQIRAASHASGLRLTRVYPRIFSPNSDGWNDKVVFEFDNPDLAALSGKIYDLGNAFVAELAIGPTTDSTLVWDGKDAGGKTVPGGIYIYQIEQGGTAASGAIVVAR